MPWWGWVVIAFAVLLGWLFGFALAKAAGHADEIMGHKDKEG